MSGIEELLGVGAGGAAGAGGTAAGTGTVLAPSAAAGAGTAGVTAGAGTAGTALGSLGGAGTAGTAAGLGALAPEAAAGLGALAPEAAAGLGVLAPEAAAGLGGLAPEAVASLGGAASWIPEAGMGALAEGPAGLGVLAPEAGGALANVSGIADLGILTPAEAAANVAPGALTGESINSGLVGGLQSAGNAAWNAAKSLGQTIKDNPLQSAGVTAQGYKELRDALKQGSATAPPFRPLKWRAQPLAAPQFSLPNTKLQLTPAQRLALILRNQTGGQ